MAIHLDLPVTCSVALAACSVALAVCPVSLAACSVALASCSVALYRLLRLQRRLEVGEDVDEPNRLGLRVNGGLEQGYMLFYVSSEIEEEDEL